MTERNVNIAYYWKLSKKSISILTETVSWKNASSLHNIFHQVYGKSIKINLKFLVQYKQCMPMKIKSEQYELSEHLSHKNHTNSQGFLDL